MELKEKITPLLMVMRQVQTVEMAMLTSFQRLAKVDSINSMDMVYAEIFQQIVFLLEIKEPEKRTKLLLILNQLRGNWQQFGRLEEFLDELQSPQ